VPPLFLLDSAESGGIWWSEIWQEGLLIFSFRYILSLPEFRQSGIETGIVRGLAKRSAIGIWLFVWQRLFFSSLITTTSLRHRRQPSPPPPHHNPNPPPTFVAHSSTTPATANKRHHRDTVDVARRRFTWACHVDSNV
jgi:hypothetical protein